MLQNVEDAGTVPGDGLKTDGKGFVVVLPLQPHQVRPVFLKLQPPELRADLRQLLGIFHTKAVNYIVFPHGFLI